MKLLTSALAGLAAGALLLSACAATPSAPTDAENLDVSVAFYPFGFVAERVGGDAVNLTNLTPPGMEAHDLELTAQQLGHLQSTDLLIYQSGFQPALDTALEQVTPAQSLDAASFLTLLDADATQADHDHEGEADHDHEGEADHDHEADHAEDDGHDHGAFDPHTWLDPTSMITVAEQVRDTLSKARPDSAATFASNAAALIAELTTLDTEFSTGLANCRIDTFITSHAAFGYLAHRYNLHQVGIRGLEPDVEPTAARIAEVQAIAKQEKVTTIFFETLVSPVVAESLASDLGLTTDVLDPLEGLTEASKGKDYLEVMRANLASLRTANQCQ